MSDALLPTDVERFRAALERHLGLQLDETRCSFLAEVLRRRLREVAGGAEDYLARLEGPALARDELRSLARELTVPETYFFRNADQFRAFVEQVLPERRQARPPPAPLRVLSAGCATGEEPYTLAMLLREQGPLLGREAEVRAVDVNAAALERAARGHYGAWSLRETPPAAQQRWFREAGREWVVDPAVRALVTFEERNLAEDCATLWLPEHYDVVFCRNVLMYFQPDVARAVVARITRALAPGGFLFLGHAETLRGLSADFHLRHTHGTFYYQRKDALDARPAPRGATPAPPPAAAAAPLPEPDDTWVDVIRRSSERIARLSEPGAAPTPPAAPPARPPPPRGAPELERVLELMGEERFREALALLPAAPASADLLLLRAGLLVHSGQLREAQAACHALLRVDELSAGAHYLLALCLEQAGDAHAALEHDQTAAYLDPAFAMPRLHLGLMARRRRDREAARRELSQALLLLQREDAARLLLFGGGFSREALVSLCRTELRAVEEAP